MSKNSIIKSVVSSFTCNDNKLKKHQILAVRNLVSVAKERIWVADRLDATEYDSINFNEQLSPDEVNLIKQSIRVLENLLETTEEE